MGQVSCPAKDAALIPEMSHEGVPWHSGTDEVDVAPEMGQKENPSPNQSLWHWAALLKALVKKCLQVFPVQTLTGGYAVP